MNEKQRLVLAVVVPVFIIVVALGIIENMGSYWDNWEESWWVWAAAVCAIGGSGEIGVLIETPTGKCFPARQWFQTPCLEAPICEKS
jgi:hypothetical protein